MPAAYTPLLAGAADLLATHRGYDLGAREVARAFGRRLAERLQRDLQRRHPLYFGE